MLEATWVKRIQQPVRRALEFFPGNAFHSRCALQLACGKCIELYARAGRTRPDFDGERAVVNGQFERLREDGILVVEFDFFRTLLEVHLPRCDTDTANHLLWFGCVFEFQLLLKREKLAVESNGLPTRLLNLGPGLPKHRVSFNASLYRRFLAIYQRLGLGFWETVRQVRDASLEHGFVQAWRFPGRISVDDQQILKLLRNNWWILSLESSNPEPHMVALDLHVEVNAGQCT
ncbi:hypothetical protein [Caballeronia sp. SBC1]|uniref:hypothetical protein n=1 Tax=Caballeronia sp. SBC1 TaxID=2705548 RepID=UPI001A9E7E57|nr:hypothetical protein [Caballeronia sp. SBC1]